MSTIKGLDAIVNIVPNTANTFLWGESSKKWEDCNGWAEDLILRPLTYVVTNAVQSAAVGFATAYATDNAYLSVAASAATFVGTLGVKLAKLYHEGNE